MVPEAGHQSSPIKMGPRTATHSFHLEWGISSDVWVKAVGSGGVFSNLSCFSFSGESHTEEGAWVPESLHRKGHPQNKGVFLDCYNE